MLNPTSDIMEKLIPWTPNLPGLAPPSVAVLAPLDPSQETQTDSIGYHYRGMTGVPWVRHSPLPPAGLSQHGAVAASSSQTLAARAVAAALPGIVRQNGPSSTLLAAQNVATLDNVPDSISGGRTAWVTSAQKAAAVDVNGNLLLKNISNAVGTTPSPSTTSTSYVVIPEMTLTLTTKGNKVIIIFTGNVNTTATICALAIFKDGVQLSADFEVSTAGLSGTGGVLVWQHVVIADIDTPTAASHTYDIRWKTEAAGNTIQSLHVGRTLQVVELG